MTDAPKTYAASVVQRMIADARAVERELCINMAAELRDQVDAQQASQRQQAINIAVAAERERCASICRLLAVVYHEDLTATACFIAAEAAIIKGE